MTQSDAPTGRKPPPVVAVALQPEPTIAEGAMKRLRRKSNALNRSAHPGFGQKI
jgi:hypothetical protein